MVIFSLVHAVQNSLRIISINSLWSLQMKHNTKCFDKDLKSYDRIHKTWCTGMWFNSASLVILEHLFALWNSIQQSFGAWSKMLETTDFSDSSTDVGFTITNPHSLWIRGVWICSLSHTSGFSTGLGWP